MEVDAARTMYEYYGEFEVHLTVRLGSKSRLDDFRDWCACRQCKCAQIVLARGHQVDQLMATWRVHMTTLHVATVEAQHRANELHDAAITVQRIKIEAGPLNQEVPQHDADIAGHLRSNYFEHHVKLLRDPSASDNRLLQACVEQEAHLSRNAWRKSIDGKEERFVTLRSYGMGRLSSETRLRLLLRSLGTLGERVIEVESEYCVYDSNLELDRGWLTSTF